MAGKAYETFRERWTVPPGSTRGAVGVERIRMRAVARAGWGGLSAQAACGKRRELVRKDTTGNLRPD